SRGPTTIETMNSSTLTTTMVPAQSKYTGSPRGLGSATSQLSHGPNMPQSSEMPRVSQNISRMFRAKLLAVAAGTISSALMSNAPTVYNDRFTKNASKAKKI